MRDGRQGSAGNSATSQIPFTQSRQAPEEPQGQSPVQERRDGAPGTQLRIYENVVPVSRTRHGRWSLEKVTDYTFCRNVNSVPLMAGEFSSAASEYPIVFTVSDDVVLPAVALGIRAGENAYVTGQGDWQAEYIPAFVRRYPFAFSSDNEGKTFTLCIDEAFSGFNQDRRGERLFEEEGKPTAFVERMLTFLQRFQSEFGRTQAFCQNLKALNLLEPMQAQFNLNSGERMALRGFSVVSRARLKTLSPGALVELLNSGELEYIYTHIVSMSNFRSLRHRISAGNGRSKRDN